MRFDDQGQLFKYLSNSGIYLTPDFMKINGDGGSYTRVTPSPPLLQVRRQRCHIAHTYLWVRCVALRGMWEGGSPACAPHFSARLWVSEWGSKLRYRPAPLWPLLKTAQKVPKFTGKRAGCTPEGPTRLLSTTCHDVPRRGAATTCHHVVPLRGKDITYPSKAIFRNSGPGFFFSEAKLFCV